MGSEIKKAHERDVYFVSPLADVLVAGGGLSIAFFFLLVLMGYGPYSTSAGIRPTLGITIAGSLAFVVNYPHFAATNFRLYQSYDRMMQFPKTSFLSPVVVVLGLAVALVNMDFASWYGKLFLTWSGYHFCAQTKGIALLYARRLGVPIDRLTRTLLVIAAHTPWAYATVNAETFQVAPFYSIKIPRGLPAIEWRGWGFHGWVLSDAWIPTFHTVAHVIFWGGVISGLACLVLIGVRMKKLPPTAAWLPVVAQTIWFGPLGAGSAAFNEFVPFFHSLQYLIIAWLFQLKEESATAGFQVGLETVVWETVKWLSMIVAGGVLLFVIWPHALAANGYALPHALGCVNAAIQIHHFFVDGVIWKIRDPRTRSMLAGNVFDLAGSPRELLAV